MTSSIAWFANAPPLANAMPSARSTTTPPPLQQQQQLPPSLGQQQPPQSADHHRAWVAASQPPPIPQRLNDAQFAAIDRVLAAHCRTFTNVYAPAYRQAFARAWLAVDPALTLTADVQRAWDCSALMQRQGYPSWALTAQTLGCVARECITAGSVPLESFLGIVEQDSVNGAGSLNPLVEVPRRCQNDFNAEVKSALDDLTLILRAASDDASAQAAASDVSSAAFQTAFAEVWVDIDPFMTGRMLWMPQLIVFVRTLMMRGWATMWNCTAAVESADNGRDEASLRRGGAASTVLSLAVLDERLGQRWSRQLAEAGFVSIADVATAIGFVDSVRRGRASPSPSSIAPAAAGNSQAPSPSGQSSGAATSPSRAPRRTILSLTDGVITTSGTTDNDPEAAAAVPETSRRWKLSIASKTPRPGAATVAHPHHRAATATTLQECRFCVACLEQERTVVCLPCRHVALCVGCAKSTHTAAHAAAAVAAASPSNRAVSVVACPKCPLCRADVDAFVNLFL